MDKTFFITAAEHRFFAQQRGDSPRAVFLHGFGGDLSLWDSLWQNLPADFSALRYDLRGFGQSPYQMDERFSHADDLLAILDQQQLQECDIIGVSQGGAVALNFALSHPERVRKLVLISPGMVAWEWSENWQNLWSAIVEQARTGQMDKARDLWWQHPLFTSTRQSSAAKKLQDSIRRYSGAEWVADYQQHALPDIERIHGLSLPTLLLSGGRDMDDFRLIADTLEASVEAITRVDFPKQGHLLNLEIPQRCAQEIVKFLKNK